MEYKRRQLTAHGADVFAASIQTLKAAKQKEEAKSDWMAEIAKKQQALKLKKNKNFQGEKRK